MRTRGWITSVGLCAVLGWAGWQAATAQQTAAAPVPAPAPRVIAPLGADDAAKAQSQYQQYCALCHGRDRAGHANDEAPSLKSRTLFESAFTSGLFDMVAYGRPGTAMGGYLDDVGGPLSRQDIRRLTTWLRDEIVRETGRPIVRVPIDEARIHGDATRGGEIYASTCASCHGAKGEGGLGTALGNPAMLKLTPDHFLRYAIEHGRDTSPMPAFKDILSAQDIDAVVAYLRSKDNGWQATTRRLDTPPAPGSYILNPNGPTPRFTLKEDLYVTAAELDRVLKTRPRIVLLDTRVTSMWQQAHIAGAVPIPYYSSREQVIQDLPRDGTWIVAYCECPRAAAESVVRKLRDAGFRNTAVLWEGIGGWITQGYPTVQGTLENAPPQVLIEHGRGLANVKQVGAANWREAGGSVVADARTGENSGFLVTPRDYTDFETEIDFRVSADANSGVYSRCRNGEQPNDVDCYEANIFDARPAPEFGTGAVVNVAAVAPHRYKAGTRWNTYRIRMQGDHLQVWLNGAQTVDVRDAKLQRGPLALQYNSGTLQIRRWTVRAL